LTYRHSLGFFQVLVSGDESGLINIWTLKDKGVNFINILRTRFFVRKRIFGAKILYESLFSGYVLALNKLSYEKRAHKMLMKLTQGIKLLRSIDPFGEFPVTCLSLWNKIWHGKYSENPLM
jgi:hypothetical protein